MIQRRLLTLAAVLGLFLVACGPGADGSAQPADGPSADQELALQTLMSFFDHLNAARYQEASELYGGSYDVLLGYNPEVDPNDHAALLQRACVANGFQCLQVRRARLEGTGSPSHGYRFVVEFSTPDGGLFVRTPCCGAGSADMPTESQFTFTVASSNDGVYRVQELPVYVP